MTHRPPSTRIQGLSWNPTFAYESSSRDVTITGRIPASIAFSDTRAERLDERTDANVASASTNVPGGGADRCDCRGGQPSGDATELKENPR